MHIEFLTTILSVTLTEINLFLVRDYLPFNKYLKVIRTSSMDQYFFASQLLLSGILFLRSTTTSQYYVKQRLRNVLPYSMPTNARGIYEEPMVSVRGGKEKPATACKGRQQCTEKHYDLGPVKNLSIKKRQHDPLELNTTLSKILCRASNRLAPSLLLGTAEHSRKKKKGKILSPEL